MYFSGATWTTLFVAGIILVLAFWYAYGIERRDKQKKRRDSGLAQYQTQESRSDAGKGEQPSGSQPASGLYVGVSPAPRKGARALGSGASYLAALRRIHGRKP